MLIFYFICAMISFISAVVYFIFSDKSIVRKINYSVYCIFTGVYFLITDRIINFICKQFTFEQPYLNILISGLAAIILVGFALTMISLFKKDEGFSKIAYNVYAVAVLMISIALGVHIYLKPFYYLFMLMFIITTLILSELCALVSLVELNTKANRILYFVITGTNAVFWIVALILFMTNTSSYLASPIFYIEVVSVLILSFCAVFCGIGEIKKGIEKE